MDALQELRNEILHLKNTGVINKSEELSLLNKMNAIQNLVSESIISKENQLATSEDNNRMNIIGQNGNTGEHYEVNDSIVESVIESYKKRSALGKEKYGVTLDRNDLKLLEWMQHLQEELMDATLYIEKIKQTLTEPKWEK